MTELKLVKTVFLKAPPSHVWRFLTEADQLALWFHRGEKNVEKGGQWNMVTNSYGKDGERMMWGDVLEYDPPKKLKHVFTHNYLDGVETVCTWTLQEADGGTVLTLVHEGFEKVAENAFGVASDHDKGWDGFFARLRHVTQ